MLVANPKVFLDGGLDPRLADRFFLPMDLSLEVRACWGLCCCFILQNHSHACITNQTATPNTNHSYMHAGGAEHGPQRRRQPRERPPRRAAPRSVWGASMGVHVCVKDRLCVMHVCMLASRNQHKSTHTRTKTQGAAPPARQGWS